MGFNVVTLVVFSGEQWEFHGIFSTNNFRICSRNMWFLDLKDLSAKSTLGFCHQKM